MSAFINCPINFKAISSAFLGVFKVHLKKKKETMKYVVTQPLQYDPNATKGQLLSGVQLV